MERQFKPKIGIIIFGIFIMVLNLIIKYYHKFVDKVYSTSINKAVRQFLSMITGILPFSLAEVLVHLLLLIDFSKSFYIFNHQNQNWWSYKSFFNYWCIYIFTICSFHDLMGI